METVQFAEIQRVLTRLKIDPDEITNQNTCFGVKTEPIEMNRDQFKTHFERLFQDVFYCCNFTFDLVRTLI